MLANAIDQAIIGCEEIDSSRTIEIAAALVTMSNDLGP
jgi:hypothetical protein